MWRPAGTEQWLDFVAICYSADHTLRYTVRQAVDPCECGEPGCGQPIRVGQTCFAFMDLRPEAQVEGRPLALQWRCLAHALQPVELREWQRKLL